MNIKSPKKFAQINTGKLGYKDFSYIMNSRLLPKNTIFYRLRKHRLKINLSKSFFGATEVSYLGFKLTPEGIKPGADKLKPVATATPPKDIT
jgi:hypothetical protein